MITRAEYLKQLKELTDEIRKKDESERSWEDKYYLWHEKPDSILERSAKW